MVQLIAATGLRIGELLALRWSALDLDIGTLAVRESVFEGKFQRPKTMKALRTIPLERLDLAAVLVKQLIQVVERDRVPSSLRIALVAVAYFAD